MKKRYADGGVISNTNYPFGQGQSPISSGTANTGYGSAGPLVQINNPSPPPQRLDDSEVLNMRRGGKVKTKKYASGGKISSASKRADGCAQRGKTRGRIM